MKKLVLLIATILLCQVAAWGYDFKVDGIYYSITSADEVEVTNDGSEDDKDYTGNVVIPAQCVYEGKTYKVTSVEGWAFMFRSALTSITLPDGVISIGNNAFSLCSSLASVSLPKGLTHIGRSAFSSCSSLVSITLPDGLISIGDMAFGGCSSLTSITISDKNAHYSSLDGILFNKDKTILMSYPAGKKESDYTLPDEVTSISTAAFAACYSLASIIVSDKNTHYSSLDGVLFNKDKTILLCYPAGKKEAIYTIPAGVKSIEMGAFIYSPSLTSISLPGGLTSIGEYAFQDCSSLTSVALSDGLTTIGEGAFYKCSSLASITLPDGLISIGDMAFQHCSSLAKVTALGKSPAECGRDAWYDISSARVLHVPAGSEELYRNAEGWGHFTTIIGDASSISGTTIPAYRLSINDGSISVVGIASPLPLAIYRLNGELMSEQVVSDGETVSTQSLPSGVYIIKVGEWSEKVVIDNTIN